MLKLDFNAWRTLRLSVSSRMAIALLVSLVSTVTAGVVNVVELNANRAQTLATAEENFGQVASTVELELDHVLDPIERVLDGLQASLDVSFSNSSPSETTVQYLQGRIRGVDYVQRLYFADLAGNFVAVAKTYPNFEAITLPAGKPAHSARLVQNTGGAGFVERRFLYDSSGQLLDADNRYSSKTDVRNLDWYQLALRSEGAAHSEPRLLPDSGDMGVTVSQRLASGGVVAADVTLASLGSALRGRRSTDSFRSIIFEYPGEITASDEMKWTFDENRSNGRVRFRSQPLADIDSAIIRALSQAIAHGFRSGFKTVYAADGSQWAIWLREVKDGVFEDHFLASFVKTDELFETASRQFRNNMLITVLGILAGLFLAVVLSAMISRPIVLAVRDVERLTAFDLGEEESHPSNLISEFNSLHKAMASLRIALRNFATYVPRQLVQRLVSGRVLAEIAGHRQEITLLFTDIENFTAISEAIDAEELTRDISDYLGLVSGVLMNELATVDKFIGDAVMAFWNAPEPIAAHAEVACLAALKVRAAIHAFNDERQKIGKIPFRTRLGLHTGMAVVGTIGSEERANYTAIGATVNLASRIEGINKVFGTEILISADVRERIGSRFAVRPIDIVQAKGTSTSVRLYELMGSYDDDERLRPQPDCEMMVGSWLTAFENHNGRNWDGAIAALNDHLIFWPEDRAAHELLRRAEGYRKFPPPLDWDGVEKLMSK